MKTLNEAQVKQARVLEPFFPVIQEYMNANVKGPAPVSSTKVFAALSAKLDGMTQEKFQPALSLAIRGEMISGFFGKKGKTGGYLPVSFAEVASEDEGAGTEESESDGALLDLGNGFTLQGSDINNWKMVRPSGPPLYFTTFERACERAAELAHDADVKKRVQSGKIKIDKGDISELLAAVKAAQTELRDLIREGLAPKVKTMEVAPLPGTEAEVEESELLEE